MNSGIFNVLKCQIRDYIAIFLLAHYTKVLFFCNYFKFTAMPLTLASMASSVRLLQPVFAIM